MYLRIIMDQDFDPSIFYGRDCKVQGNVITAAGTLDELNEIISLSETVLGDRTIIIRKSSKEIGQ